MKSEEKALKELKNRIASVLFLIGNVDHSKGHGFHSAEVRGNLLNDIRTILTEEII